MVLKILVCGMPVAGTAAVLLLKRYAWYIAGLFPQCIFYRTFHLLCPACGNTRSVLSLLNGDIAGSLSFNITPVVLLLLACAFYIELAAYAFGKHMKIVPRGNTFLFTLMLSCLIYYAVRNFIPITAA